MRHSGPKAKQNHAQLKSLLMSLMLHLKGMNLMLNNRAEPREDLSQHGGRDENLQMSALFKC